MSEQINTQQETAYKNYEALFGGLKGAGGLEG